MAGKFTVEYATYTPHQIVKPDRFNRRKSFPTLKGAFGFWYRKAVENQGVAHIIHGSHMAQGVDIKRVLRDGGDIDAFLRNRLKV
jgi:hypothetical protein